MIKGNLFSESIQIRAELFSSFPNDDETCFLAMEQKGIQCGGGGGGGGPDREYNARLASLMEKGDIRSDEMFRFWQTDYRPYSAMLMQANREVIPWAVSLEKDRINAESQAYKARAELTPWELELGKDRIQTEAGRLFNERELAPFLLGLGKEKTATETARQIYERSLLEPQTDLTREQIQAARRLLPHQTELTEAQIGSALQLLPQQTEFASATMSDKMDIMRQRRPVRQAFYGAALNGMDPQSQANRAAADAAQAFAGSSAAMSRAAARMGVNPNSGRFAAMNNTNAIQRAQAIGGARTQGRIQGEREKFGRLQAAMGHGQNG